ncbi:MAG: hypothetical protein M3Y37_11295 [Chloroflexota bacterium]|nr:hypothetical protein [Chloroflexota bacterium]
MSTLRWGSTWSFLVLLVVVLLGTELRAGATVTGTPTPEQCGQVTDAGSPVASPDARSATPAAGTPVTSGDLAQVLDALSARGITVAAEEVIDQEVLSADQVTRLVLSGGSLAGPAEVQVYAYATAEDRAADAARITPDGNLTTVMISWIAPPHFFCGERVIILYLGDDPAMMAVLTELFGPQFAGQ